jgi:regulator of sirC expression with transglutaminase-like and TPR domain
MSAGLRAFAELVSAPDTDIDLGLGALLIAQIEHGPIDAAAELERLDDLAARSGAAAVGDPVHALHRLREFLFEEEGFRGNTDDYYDPRNSCLKDVLDRRIGIPITLSLVMMEIGRRVGLPIVGVGLPGHFVVRADVAAEPVLLDPFDGGAIVTHEGAAALVARALGRSVALTEAHFAPVGRRQILTRMLLNLKSAYARCRGWEKALTICDYLLTLDRSPVHVRDRGTALVKLGEVQRGLADWERYLSAAPDADDAGRVRAQLRRLRQHLAALN